MTMIRNSLYFAALAATTGCVVKGLPGFSSGGTTPHTGAVVPGAPSTSPAGGGGGGDLPAGTGDAASVSAAYNAFTFESCQNFDCVGRFKKAAGVTQGSNSKGYIIEMNPRASGKNPDPAWLVGWDSLPKSEMANDADVVYEALVTAATMKSWQAHCYKDYEALHTKLVAGDQQMQAAIDAAKAKPTPAQRIEALLALRTNERLDELSFEDSLGKVVGGRYALELAILDAYRSSDLEYVYYVVNGIEAPKGIVERGRPRGEVAAERESYCAAALEGHVSAMPKPEQYGSNYLEHGAKAVKPVIDRGVVDTFATARKATYAENAKTFAATKSYASLDRAEQESTPAKGELAHVITETAVKKVKRGGTKLTIELANVHKNTAPYACKQTGGLDADLKPLLACKLRDVIVDQHATVTFDDVPESMQIQPGDRLEMFAKKTAQTEKTLVDTLPVFKSKETWAFEGTYLVGVVR
jgi:hypothetical protein